MRIAIAGVGGIGKHILDALLKTPHSLCALSTRKRPDLESLGLEVFTVDYSSHSSLVAALQGAELCICAFPFFRNADQCYQAELNLIHAAEESGVSKFVPSEWEGLLSRRKTILPFREYKIRLVEYLNSRSTQMTWTCFTPGVCMDYYSPASLGTNGKDTLASSETLWPAGFTFIVDLNKQVAEIPGDGDTAHLAMTAADDIGGFIAAACTQLHLSQWPVGEWGICGGLYTPNEIVSIATKVRGAPLCKMRLTLGELKTGHIPREIILSKYQKEDKTDLAKVFRWKVLIATMNNEFLVEHETHGVRYEFQGLEQFLRKWWPQLDE